MVACAIGQKTYSSEPIQQQPKELVPNVPAQELKHQIDNCGSHSGRDVDKFKGTGLAPQPARHVDAPIMGECVAHMECRVEQATDTGDKVLFIATVADACADGDFPGKV